MLIYFLINLGLNRLTYTALAAFAQIIHDGFVAFVADYASPNPAMPAFQTDIDNLNTAIINWGPIGARGSRADHLTLLAAAQVVRNDLRMLADYAQNTKPNDPESWIQLGFKSKRPKSKPKPLEMVQNLRYFVARNVPSPYIKLRWKRPLDTAISDVKGYFIQRNNVGIYPGSPDGHAVINIVGIVPNTSFIDDDPFVGENWYWVTPFNSLGFGVTSAGIMVVSAKTK